MSPSSIEPATLWFLVGHLDRLAIETVDYLWFKLFQYSEMTDNAWGVSKHVQAQVSWAVANEIKHDHSPVVIVDLDPRHD